MQFDVLVINPNPLLNLVHTGEYTPGAVNRVPSLTMAAEGKGVNVARVLARHGRSVAITGFAGGYSGAWLRDLVRAEGIHDAWVETAAPLRVGFMASGCQDCHPTTVFPNGFPVTAAECGALLERIEFLAPSVRLVIASGSVPDPAAIDLYLEVLKICRAHGVPCWVDAYGPSMGRALGGPVAPALCKPNREEYTAGFDWDRAGELHVTDGEAAIEVSSGSEGRWRVYPPVIRQVNPIGCGDCYLAGLAHGWLEGLPLEIRLRYSAAAGAANALRQDVAMISPADIAPLKERVRVESA